MHLYIIALETPKISEPGLATPLVIYIHDVLHRAIHSEQ
jgi:hypothetical protein